MVIDIDEWKKEKVENLHLRAFKKFVDEGFSLDDAYDLSTKFIEEGQQITNDTLHRY